MSRSFLDQTDGYRADVDGLRAVAILIVVLFHAGIPGFSGGFVGVDVFFVISGFLITRLLLHERLSTGTLRFGDFYARRVRRLFPAFFLVVSIGVVLWCAFFMGVPRDTEAFFSSTRFSLIGLANHYFTGQVGGYFSGASEEMPFLHLWSLAVEEQFYIVWPALIALFSAGSFAGGKDPGRFRLFLGLGGVIGASFLVDLWLLKSGRRNEAFYWMPCRAWELGIGGLLVGMISPFRQRVERFSPQIRSLFVNGLSLLALAGLMFVTFRYSARTRFPGVAALVPTLATAWFILAGALPTKPWISRWLSLRPMVFIGLISYGLYLWHWPLLAMFRVHRMGVPPGILEAMGLLIFSGLLSYLSLRFVERPVRSALERGPTSVRNFRTFGVLVSLSGLIFVSTYGLQRTERSPGPEWNEFLESVRERRDDVYACVDSIELVGSRECEFPSALKKTSATIALWGDSHARALAPLMDVYRKTHPVDFVLYSRSGTPSLVPNSDWKFEPGPDGIDKRRFQAAVFSDIARKTSSLPKKPVSIILFSRWMVYSGTPTLSLPSHVRYVDPDSTRSGSLSLIERSLTETLGKLFSAGVHRVLIPLPYPEFRYQITRCRLRRPESCGISRSEMDSYRSEVVGILERTARRFEDRVRLVDPVEIFCDSEECPQFVERENDRFPVVFDQDHPSQGAAVRFGKAIEKSLDWLSAP